MKNSKKIIKHLKSNSAFKNLDKYECFRQFNSILPNNLNEFIEFNYVKNNTLFFVFKHPSYQMEFNYNLKTVNILLKDFLNLKRDDLDCSFLKSVKEIKSFVKSNIENRVDFSKIDTETFYQERASSNFKNIATNRELFNSFEEIREIICSSESKK